MKTPQIIGVRHHSPSCALLVAERIRSLRPAFVLIEGPSDFNERIPELLLTQHQLPLAIYSYLSAGSVHFGSWTPFAEYSPEWQALVGAQQCQAKTFFIDLPAWDKAFAQENRYADCDDEEVEAAREDYHQALSEKLVEEGYDALWDRLFEDSPSYPPSPADLAELEKNLAYYFNALRGEALGSSTNQQRESLMAQWIAWAMAQNAGEVLVVCGGYHAPALARLWQTAPTQQPAVAWPSLEEEVDALHYGSYLVPYSFKRLDSFTGYASGMPSPGYYQWWWKHCQLGHDFSCFEQTLLSRLLSRLRGKKLAVSTADFMGLYSHAQALSGMRGRHHPLRRDWLDALASSLIKDALDAPLPWTYRGLLRAQTHPLLVEAIDVFSGQRQGKLAPETPLPPLVHAVQQTLQALGIPERGTLKLQLSQATEREKSQALHRLHILQIPGIERSEGSKEAFSKRLEEVWNLSQHAQRDSALIEASIWGANLETAAQGKLEAQVRAIDPQAESAMEALADVLNKAAFAALPHLSDSCLQALTEAIHKAGHFDSFGAALDQAYALFCFGDALQMTGMPLLVTILEEACDRALWLFEMPSSVEPSRFNKHLATVRAITRIAADATAAERRQQVLLSNLNPERVIAVMSRKAQLQEAPALSRGAALGSLFVLLEEAQHQVLCESVLQLFSSLASAELGDALLGLLSLAREVLIQHGQLLAGFDESLQALDDTEFLQALPALRAAFGWLPPQERGKMGQAVVHLYQGAPFSGFALTQGFSDDPHRIAYFALAEKTALAQLEKWHIPLS